MVDPIMSDHLSDLMRRLQKQLGPTSIVVTPDRPHVREFLEMDRVA
jgi:ABC-type transporter Mla maintaining outer membrane lipid asymmetry ATPase subunit MlaF